MMLKKSFILSCIVLSLGLQGCASFSPNSEAKSKKSEVNALDKEKAFDAAIRPKTVDEALTRGDTAVKNKDYQRAIIEYSFGLDLDKDSQPLYDRLGRVYYLNGDFERCLNAFNIILKNEPNSIIAHQYLGLCSFKQGDSDQAETHLEKSIELDKARISLAPPSKSGDGSILMLNVDSNSPWKAYNTMGIIQDQKKQHAKAIYYFKQAGRIRPNDVNILNNLGYSSYLSGDWSQAKSYFNQAIKQKPNFATAWYNLGLIQTREQNWRQAELSFSKIMPKQDAYNDMGVILMQNNDLTRARTYFQKALETSPQYHEKAANNLELLNSMTKEKE